MLSYFEKKLNPTFYQGEGKRPHFEGWYFKIVDAGEKNSLAIIPGIYKGSYEKEDHSFIQVFDGQKNKALNIIFPSADFSFSEHTFKLDISDNEFSREYIKLNLHNDQITIKGTLSFTKITDWPKSLISPGIMGWYSWVPFMECYHGIVSLNHRIEGELNINNIAVTFTGGKGYTEKDWGKSFPEAWVWFQCNHFKSENTSITGSIAIIPWIKKPFPGFIVGLWHQGRLYRFTTYLGSKIIEFKIEHNQILWILEQKELRLEIRGIMAPGSPLYAPTLNGMNREIIESLSSEIRIRLSEGQNLILEDSGKNAGFEVAGNTERLLDMYSKKYER